MAHATIENIDFTLFYDYDQLRDKNLQKLTDRGKGEWFMKRMLMVFLEPLSRIFDKDSLAHIELRCSEKPERDFMLGAFSVLLNGIESCGSFITGKEKPNKDNFNKYISEYLKVWNDTIKIKNKQKTLADILWSNFRNSLAHGFHIKNGGIEYLDNGKLYDLKGAILVVDPKKAFGDFSNSLDQFFLDINDSQTKVGKNFIKKFNNVYPT